MFGEMSKIKETNQISDAINERTINDIIKDSISPVFDEFKEKKSDDKARDVESEAMGDVLRTFLKDSKPDRNSFVDAYDDWKSPDKDSEISKIKDIGEKIRDIEEIKKEHKAFIDRFADDDIYSMFNEGPNCMCFALDMTHDKDGKVFDSRPGLGDFSKTCSQSELLELLEKKGSAERLFEILEADCEAVGKGFKRVDENYVPKDGEILGALMYSTSKFTPDFHFVRAGESGVWYHKRGIERDVKITDDSGRLITKPEENDWGIYDQFCGRFVTWDNKKGGLQI